MLFTCSSPTHFNIEQYFLPFNLLFIDIQINSINSILNIFALLTTLYYLSNNNKIAVHARLSSCVRIVYLSHYGNFCLTSR